MTEGADERIREFEQKESLVSIHKISFVLFIIKLKFLFFLKVFFTLLDHIHGHIVQPI